MGLSVLLSCGHCTSSAPLGTLEDSIMTLTFITLLGLGLCWGPWDQVQAGLPPKPSIWADPGPRVSKGSPVTIWCQGSLPADRYSLYKERGFQPLDTRIPQASSNKAGFPIKSMSPNSAGRYRCAYSSSRHWSERSDPLSLVMTGEYSAPSLSAHPGPVVASGGRVSLFCISKDTSGPFHLLKEGGAEQLQHRKSDQRSYAGTWQAVFPVGPVSSSHGGTYRCYGSSSSNPNVWSQPSAALHLEVTGVYREPSLSAQPGPLVLPGESLTLQCHSEPGFHRFALTKDEGTTPPQSLHGKHSPNFPLGPVNLTHGGQYRCYSGHNLSYVWSAPSPPLDILITGIYEKPSLSAQPGPSVPWGANVTLQCGSEVKADTFHLHREGSLDPPQWLHLQDTAGPSQANFTISPVTWSHNGTYRCYSSHSSSPFQLSQPSDPLELLVSEGSEYLPLPTTESGPQSAEGLQRSLNVLTGVSVTLLLLLSLFLFFLLRHQNQSKDRTSGATDPEPKDRGLHPRSNPAVDTQEEPLYAAMKDPQPRERVVLDPQNRTHDNSQRETYALVTLSTSRQIQGMVPSPSPLSEELLDRKGRQVEENRQMDSQAAASEDSQDLTYAQLNLLTPKWETSTPLSSPSEKPPDEPSVYAALSFH
ncbi:leukocyte immunoglobulin-like receptor subfamily B member 3 isoform X2 [Phyllostomus hastatus]|uniref:leukocyte immunoglobulin-like receptor subfamily B member 3 isoform X2 n=1 Tax=Phyllostomus hastatus TaxID=9423 RepID=UPI001E683783|nr:leukocyte immunoglobulin-like receptor subfamily B member 3 isoform X2 [Phyllostomus hastatus]